MSGRSRRLVSSGLLVLLSVKAATGQDFVVAAPGRIEGADDVMQVGAATTAIAKEVLVAEGERVTKGAILARLDCEPVEREIAVLEAEVAVAKAVLRRLQDGPRPEEIAIASARVHEALAASEEASAVFERRLSMKGGVATSEASILTAEHEAAAAAAALDVARAQLRLLEAGPHREDILEASARVAAAEARAEEAKARLSRCIVEAPAEGIILSKNVTPGQLVTTLLPVPLFRMVSDYELRVRAEIDERDLSAICVGQPAIVSVAGYPDESIPASVVSLLPGMGRRTVRSDDPAEKGDKDVREAILEIDGEQKHLPIGLRVIVRFEECRDPRAIAHSVPASGISNQ